MLFVSHIFKLLIYKTQTNSCYQFYGVQLAYNRCVLFHVMRVKNHDLYGLCYRTACVLWKVQLVPVVRLV